MKNDKCTKAVWRGINVVNTEEEVDFTCIHSNDETNVMSMNDDDDLSVNIMQNFYRNITTKIFLQKHNTINEYGDFLSYKCYFGFIIK